MPWMEALLGRRRLAAAKRVGLFMLVCVVTGIPLMIAGAASGTAPLLWVGLALLVAGVLPLFLVGDLVNALVYGTLRARGRAAAAAGLGMRFARHDPFAIDRLGFEGIGEGAAENVAWGTLDGREVIWFEWSRGLLGRDGSFACALVDLGTDAPRMNLARRGRSESDLPEVSTESGEFNRAFRLSSRDRRFATTFCDAPLMAWLLDAWPPEIQVETGGRHVLLWAPDLRRLPGVGTTLHFVLQMLGRGGGTGERVLAHARDLAGRVPRVLPSLWPASEPPLTPAPA